jgi:hypothetical protein
VVTGPAVPPGGEELREALAAALAHHSWCTYGQPMVSVTGVVESRGQCNCLPARQEDADALMPVVEAIARRRAAEELRAAADRHQVDLGAVRCFEAEDDRARADALEAE